MTPQTVTDAGPAGAGLLYDARRGVYYAKPALRGWTAAKRLRLRRRGLPVRRDRLVRRLSQHNRSPRTDYVLFRA